MSAQSRFGGRPIWFDKLTGDSTSLVPQGYTYNATQPGFTHARGPTQITLSMLSASAVGSYADGIALRVDLVGSPDMEILFRWRVETSTENLPGVWLRGDGTFSGAVQSRDANCYW